MELPSEMGSIFDMWQEVPYLTKMEKDGTV